MLDLGTLGVFKYYGFFAAGDQRVLDTVGLGLPLPLVAIALPVGISFIVFQAISYVGRRLPARRSSRRARSTSALYLTFFPHLVAGPIVRAKEFLPQLAKPRDPREGRRRRGRLR